MPNLDVPNEHNSLKISRIDHKLIFFDQIKDAFAAYGFKLKKGQLNLINMEFSSNGRNILLVQYPNKGLNIQIEIHRDSNSSNSSINDLEI